MRLRRAHSRNGTRPIRTAGRPAGDGGPFIFLAKRCRLVPLSIPAVGLIGVTRGEMQWQRARAAPAARRPSHPRTRGSFGTQANRCAAVILLLRKEWEMLRSESVRALGVAAAAGVGAKPADGQYATPSTTAASRNVRTRARRWIDTPTDSARAELSSSMIPQRKLGPLATAGLFSLLAPLTYVIANRVPAAI